MKINIVSTKLIKPCSPTPQNLKKYKISSIDELMPQMNIGIILFYYPLLSNNNREQTRRSQLEESLASILPNFYPLAGRFIQNDGFVDCNDQGAEFVEAEVVDDDVDFLDLVSKVEYKQLIGLLPSKFHHADETPTNPLLSVQVTEFKCGGLVISASVSHRIFDSSSAGTFIAAWSKANSNSTGEITISASFDPILLFPGLGSGPGTCLTFPHSPSLVAKRFSFNKEAIASVKSKLARPNYSRVRVVCAIIAKALIGLDRAQQGGKSRQCLIVQSVNMRGRTIPPLHKDSCGNLAVSSLTQYISETREKNAIGIQELVDMLGDSVEKTVGNIAHMLSPGGNPRSTIIEHMADIIGKSSSGEVNVIFFSDCSKFGFYEADFGWGKPVGVGIGKIPAEKNIVLVGNKESNGIEAWVHLNCKDMVHFEQDQNIKSLTTKVIALL